MSWSSYSLTDALPPPPSGFERAVIANGDTLQGLSDESGVSAEDIAQANGVTPHHRARPTCQWEQDLSAMILATGGERFAYDDAQPNACEPGLGFPSFVAGQVLNLPKGLRQPAQQSNTGTAIEAAAAGGGGVLLAAAAVVALLVLRRRRKKG